MNDQDYIRAGVELADGFQLSPYQGDEYFSLPHGNFVPPIIDCPQQCLDALAAQLYRQLLATPDSVERETAIELCNCILIDRDPTDNTIKSIVDSGELK